MKLLVMLLVALVAASPQSASGTGPVRSFETGLSPKVQVDTLSGVVEVTAHDEATVEVSTQLSPHRRNPWQAETEQNGDRVGVRLCCGRCAAPKTGCEKSGAARIILRVPAKTDLGITATSAQVSVVGVKGPVRVETVTGGISVEGSANVLKLATVGGDIAAAPDRLAEAHVTTDTGNVLLKIAKDVGAELGFSTVSGTFNGEPVAIKTRRERLGEGGAALEIQTVTGSVRLDRR